MKLIFNVTASFLFLVLLVPAQAQNDPGVPKLNSSQRIDRIIEEGYGKHEIKANPIANDEVFVRRIYLDIVGRIPTRKEALTFINSKASKKKAKLIDDLLNSDGYVSHHFNYWADILRAKTQLNGNNQSTPAGYAYEKWIKDSLRENKPYDKFVQELVSASGSSWENGAVGYYIRDYQMPLDNLALTTQVFLGTEIVCAQCHNHPFDKWTQMDYYHMAAFTYGKITTNNSPNQRKALEFLKDKKRKVSKDEYADIRRAFSEILKPVRFNNVYDQKRGLRLPHDYQYDDAKPKAVVKPATLYGNEAPLSNSEHPSETLADWITSKENERFTTVIANRLWKKALGVALIEPVDAMTDHSKPSNPELMTFLENRMKGFDYDMKKFLRMIYNTKTYQRESNREEAIAGVPYHYPGTVLRRMTAEQIWDSVVAMTIEDADAPNARHELEMKRRITEVKLIAEALYDQKPGEFLKQAYEVAQLQKELSAEIGAAQNLVAEARETKDSKKIRQALNDAQKIRRKLVTEIENRVYRDGLESKIDLVALNESDESAEEFLNELAAVVTERGEGDSSAGMDSFSKNSKFSLIDLLVSKMIEPERAAVLSATEQQREVERKKWSIDTKPERDSYRNFVDLTSKMARASEIRSPAPPGHFLREFGQSDREVVENANDQAAVTQALAMLNGPTVGAITNRYSVLSRDMSGEKFLDRLETIFLTMLSRKPRPDEVKIFQQAWKENPEAGSVQGIVWTVLNMRQFLFVE